VSLGGFQRSADARAEPAIAGVPVVRRPSGGGAIVHGTDLTYAAAVPKTHPWGGRPQLFYDALHEAMREALLGCGVDLALWPPAALPTAPANDAAFFCFDRRAAGDLVWRGAEVGVERGCKVMGSAQRRLASTVLQHGSLLLQRNRDVGPCAAHPGLADLVPGFQPATAVRPLAERWLAGIAAALGAAVVAEPGAFGRAEILGERARQFASPRWIDRR
jgi:lipoate-protein ligase A